VDISLRFSCGSDLAEERARNRELTEQLTGNTQYEVEIKTGGMQVCKGVRVEAAACVG